MSAWLRQIICFTGRPNTAHYASALGMAAMKWAWRTLPHQLSTVLDERTAGVMFVVSHHTAQSGMLALEIVIDLAHAKDIPVVVDADAELDLRKYVAAGADLVIYSSQKVTEGPASGMIAGGEKWVAACTQQNAGIGCAMKIGKEGIIGALAALQRFQTRDLDTETAAQAAAAGEMVETLAGIKGLQAAVVLDPLRPIPRVRISIDASLS